MADERPAAPAGADDPEPNKARKAIDDQLAMLSNLAYSSVIANVNLSQQNAVSAQQALNEIQVAVTGRVVALLSNGHAGAGR